MVLWESPVLNLGMPGERLNAQSLSFSDYKMEIITPTLSISVIFIKHPRHNLLSVTARRVGW